MVYVSTSPDSDYQLGSALRYATAIESGVMDVFFDHGHIVFNFGIPGIDPEPTPFRSEPPAVRVAKRGAATRLLELLFSDPTKDHPMPATIEYTYTDLTSDLVVAAGVVRAAMLRVGSTDLIELCREYGQEVAIEALRDL